MENQVISAEEFNSFVDKFNIENLTTGSKEKAIKETGASSNRSLFAIAPDKIVILPDFNIRVKNADYTAKVREIADSIIENGYYQHKPIACLSIKQGGKDVLACFDGHTRLDAVALAISEGHPIESVYVSVAPVGTTLEDITVGLVTNNSGRQLEPIAIGLVCKRLQGYGLDNTKIAKKLGYSVAYVGQLFELIGADRKIRDMVNDGQLSATEAVQTIREEGENALKVLQDAQELANQNGKPRITRKYIRKAKEPVAPVGTTPETSNPDQKAPTQSPIEPLYKTPSVTPYDALVIGEAVARSEQKGMQEALAWMKANANIVDFSHYELIHAIFPGTTVSDLRDMVN